MLTRCFQVGLLLFCVSAAFAAPHSNIIIVTLDTTRADRMGFLGSTQNLTPNLDAFAAQGVVFTRAYSQVPLTTSSHATILTGTYPQFHNVLQPLMPLSPSVPYAPAILRAAGYHTAAFLGSMMLQAKGGGAPGFDRGFDVYDADFHTSGPGEDRYSSLERRGDEVVSRALEWIKKNSNGPFFIWIHLFDPHAPYEPPEPYFSRYKDAPYDGEIAYTDAVIGKLFDQLRASKLYDESVIAVMADHGEGLGEHGEQTHGVFLYDSTIRVPLVFKMPGKEAAGKRIDARVELADVLPTMLDAVSVVKPKDIQGRSMYSMVTSDKSDSAADRPAYAESDYPHLAFGWSPLRSLRTGKYLFVEAPRSELYDQASDPKEEHDLASKSPAIAQTLSSQVDDFRAKTKRELSAVAPDLTREQTEKLRGLGYIAGTNHEGQGKAQGADPKDKIELFNTMIDVNFLMEQNKYAEALPRLQSVVGADPTFLTAYQALAQIYLQMGDMQNAIPALRKEVELAPNVAWGHFELGRALAKVRDLKGAQPELEQAVAGMPQSAEARYELALLYVNTLQLDRAVNMAKEALKLQPNYYEADLLLGFVYVNQNKPAAAIPHLKEASKTHPKAPKPHEYLAQAYEALGNKGLAGQERALAEELKQNTPH